MTSSRFFAGLSQRSWLQQLHWPVLAIRLCMASMLFVMWLQQHIHTSWLILNIDALVVLLAGYSLVAVVCGLVMPLLSVHQRWISLSSVLDVLLTAALLWLLPAQVWVGFGVSVVMLIAALLGNSAFTVMMLCAGLLSVAMLRAYLDGILQQSAPEPLHLIQALFGLIGLAMSARLSIPQDRPDRQQDPETGWAQGQSIFDAMTYLRPYHHRNQIPLTLLMLQLPASFTQRQSLLPTLTRFLNERLRISDVVVRYKTRQVVILLCDTNEQGASVIAHHIWNEGCPAQQHLIPIAISHVPFYGVATQSILDRMEQVLKVTDQTPTDRILFVSPVLRDDAK